MDPFKPNVGTDVGVGTLVGFLICFGTILILEQAQRRVHTIAQLEEYRLAPILGVLPTLPKADVKLIEGGQWTESTSESFTILRNNLLEMRAHTSSATGFIALVTSAGPQEGKSFILAELARSMVDEGLRVIVVDANLREPSMSKYFPVDTRLGLAELLTEQWTYDDISTVVEQNLEVVHAGVKRVEATRYILSQKMLNFLADVRSRADLVLIDSPGCNIADPLLLAPHVDQVIYVVGISKTDEQAVRGALDALSAVSQVGIMVNNANMKHVLPHQFVNAASKMAVRLDDFGPENVGGLIKWTGPYQQLSKSNGNGAGDVGEVIPIPTNSGESQ
jgi:Mrp family chromosome partitioning ATPase